MDYLFYFLFAFAVLLLGVQVYTAYRAHGMKGKPAPDLSFIEDPVQREQNRHLIYFFTPGCGACRSMTPVIDRLMRDHPQVIKLDASRRPDVARSFGVMAVPTMIVVVDGRIDQVLVGAQSERKLLRVMDTVATKF
jgi:thioredoxin 1